MDAVESFDLRSYISKYRGLTRIFRLKHVISIQPSKETYELLLDEIKTTYWVEMYADVYEKYKSNGGDVAFDEAYLSHAKEEYSVQLDKIEKDLNVARSTSNKESLRRNHIEKGNLLYLRGDFNEAMNQYLRSRDYIGKPEHSTELALLVSCLAIDSQNYRHASQQANKIDVPTSTPLVAAKTRALTGLLALTDGNYRTAANHFMEVDSAIINNFNNVILAEDIVVYTTLCTLATHDFADMKANLMESKTFKSLLETTPEIRGVLQNFAASNYGHILQFLESKSQQMSLDIYLSSHWSKLMALVWDRAIVQYFTPYKSLSIAKMSESLHKDEVLLENDLVRLIGKGNLSARIDSETHTLHSKVQNDREVAMKRVKEATDVHTLNVKQSLLRLSLLQNKFVVGGDDSGDLAADDAEITE